MMISEQHVEVRAYLELLQALYGASFSDNDTEGMLETSNDLSLAYAGLGNECLSTRWADEYLRHALAPSKE
ncbi:MAG: hypothetical protein V2A34_07635 [Lentisphaerota bacterium]